MEGKKKKASYIRLLLLSSGQKYCYDALHLLPELHSGEAHKLCAVSSLQAVRFLPLVVTKFISLQELKQQYCPLAEELQLERAKIYLCPRNQCSHVK